MPARMKKYVLLLFICLMLTGCRARIIQSAPTDADKNAAAGESMGSGQTEADAGENPDRTTENPEAAQKEFDENAAVEIVAGTDRALHGPGEGEGAYIAIDSGLPAARLNADAAETARQTVSAPESDRMGTAADAEMADSAFRYYTVLLKERSESLYVCKRLNLYWETVEDHVTVHKTSAEHQLILDAGAYDVSARLLPENLKVDDGWVSRKNPEIIVKIVPRSVLGGGVLNAAAAAAELQTLLSRPGWQEMDAVKNKRVLLLSQDMLEAPHLRLAAGLVIAQTANPDVYADVDPAQALRALTEEATGMAGEGIYYLSLGEP